MVFEVMFYRKIVLFFLEDVNLVLFWVLGMFEISRLDIGDMFKFIYLR